MNQTPLGSATAGPHSIRVPPTKTAGEQQLRVSEVARRTEQTNSGEVYRTALLSPAGSVRESLLQAVSGENKRSSKHTTQYHKLIPSASAFADHLHSTNLRPDRTKPTVAASAEQTNFGQLYCCPRLQTSRCR